MSSESNSSFTFPESDGLTDSSTPIYSTSAPNSSTLSFVKEQQQQQQQQQSGKDGGGGGGGGHHNSRQGGGSSASSSTKCVKVECIYSEVVRLRDMLLEKDKEIARLQRETHKLKSVIEKSELTRLPSVSSYQQGKTNLTNKKCGVSGESWPEDQGSDSARMRQPDRINKDFRSRQLIRAALGDNDFLKNLDAEQVRDIVDFMHPQNIDPGAYVIQEGEAGCHLYVSAEGQLEVLQDTRHLGTLGPGKAFGELALLYNCKRTATVRAITECKVWTLERRAFQMAMVKAGMRRMEDRLAFLRSVPLLRGLQPLLLARIADCLEVEYYPPGAYIIREGTAGHTFFIISQGRVHVTSVTPTPANTNTSTNNNGSSSSTTGSPTVSVSTNYVMDQSGNPTNMCILRELGHGDYFGEQALLKEERRSANVIALSPGVECLTLDRESFMQLIGDLSEFQQHKKSPYTSSTTATSSPPVNVVSANNNIVGNNSPAAAGGMVTSGGGRNIVESSKINIVKAASRPKELLESSPNDLELKYGDDCEDDADICLEADGNESCTWPLIPPLSSSTTSEQTTALSISCSPYFDSFTAACKGKDGDFEFDRLRLDDLEVVATLGVGGFGRVELVQVSYDTNRVFALKCLPKAHILATQQQEHVYSERNIMLSCKSPFIASLYCTFKDSKCIYLLMEACLGGELWTILRDKGSFDEDTARFVAACVLLALEFLHERDVVYRDLKPENLMLANDGYVKLVDFGFSKVVPSGHRTWTFCGTPEYVAPEVILNRGHDRTVDYWALGVLLFELLSGLPPWGPMSADATPSDSSDPLTTYNQILKGIETINFPKTIGRGAVSLIRRLCRQVPGERLGAQRGVRDVMTHRLFQGFDWEGIKAHTMKPPIKPHLRGPRDTSNFDHFDLDLEDTPDDNSGWDIDF